MFTQPLAKLLTAVILSAAAPATWAQWSVNNDLSRLSFISVKATHIAEVHKFSRLSGGIADNGKVAVDIELASIDTLIPIRNERMLEFLFDAANFPKASIHAQLDPTGLNKLAVGEVTIMALEATLTVKERQMPITTEVLVSKHSDYVVVANLQPIVLNTASLGLGDGVEKLRELAGLPNITQAVPVTFVITFDNGQ